MKLTKKTSSDDLLVELTEPEKSEVHSKADPEMRQESSENEDKKVDSDSDMQFVDAVSQSVNLEEMPLLEDEEVVCDVTAELHIFDPLKEQFILQEKNVHIEIIKLAVYKYWLHIKGKTSTLGRDIGEDINPTFCIEKRSFIFNYNFRNIMLSYMLIFPDKKSYLKFKEIWSEIYWMSLNQLPWEKLPSIDQSYIIASSSVIEEELNEIIYSGDINAEDKQHDNQEDFSSDDDDEEEEGSSRIISSEGFREPTSQRSSQSKNKSLSIAFKNNRSYIIRDDKLGVFKTGSTIDDPDLEFVGSISNIKDMNGKAIQPIMPMLYQEDTAMLLRDSNNQNSLYKMDLNKGTVVEEWGTGEKDVVNFGPNKKFDQLTNEQTILGLSKQSIFKLDPRINKNNKIVQEETTDYKTNYKFSAITTTGDGFIAVGSENGDIKLYNKLGIRAKTSIPSLGQPIKHLCASSDGKLLLATSDKSLLLIELTVKTGKNAGTIGFIKAFPATENVKTHILTVRPEHAVFITSYTKKPIKYSHAYFNTGINKQEDTIVTSTGPFAVSWKISDILSGRSSANDSICKVRRYSSNIIEDNFEYGSNKKVIVALEDDITVTKTRSFKKPSKGILFPESNMHDFFK